MTNQSTIKDAVKAHYGAIATGKGASCCNSSSSCCGDDIVDVSTGYTADELASIPAGSSLGLGCGNPTALADVRAGETVLDLGSGAGIDCFLAAKKVGDMGRVIGVDMTEAMIAKARRNAADGGFTNVEFRHGEIDNLPVDGNSVDLVVSNCVINLVPDKARVFREIHRVLKPGGRFSVSDVVSKGKIPEAVQRDMEQWAGCIAGAMEKDQYLQTIREAGFDEIEVKSEVDYDYQKTDAYSLASVTVAARKPRSGHRAAGD